jgi:hypothetical protein
MGQVVIQGAANSYTISLLEEIAEFLEGQMDVVDGSYGVPHANRAMQLYTRLEQEIERMKRGDSELLEAIKGLVWLATPHFSDKVQMEHLARCQQLIDRSHATNCPED